MNLEELHCCVHLLLPICLLRSFAGSFISVLTSQKSETEIINDGIRASASLFHLESFWRLERSTRYSEAILYRFLELHLLGDLLRGLRGGRVALTFHPESQVYQRVASKCRSLHGRWEYGIIPRGCRCAGTWLRRGWRVLIC